MTMTTATESMLRAALALARDGIFIIDADTLAYLEFNEATCRITGRSRDELNRLGPLGIWALTGGTSQALRDHYQELIAMAPATMSHRTSVLRPDGSSVEVWMDRQACQIDGRWVIMACARELARPGENSSVLTIDTLRARMEASTEPVSLIDYQAMRYIDLNPPACDVLGYSRDELLEGDLPLTGARTLEDMRGIYGGLVMHSPRPASEITTYQRSDGAVMQARVTRHAVLADGMWVIYVSLRDITRVAD